MSEQDRGLGLHWLRCEPLSCLLVFGGFVTDDTTHCGTGCCTQHTAANDIAGNAADDGAGCRAFSCWVIPAQPPSTIAAAIARVPIENLLVVFIMVP